MMNRLRSLIISVIAVSAVCAATASAHPLRGGVGVTSWHKIACSTISLTGPANAVQADYGDSVNLDANGVNLDGSERPSSAWQGWPSFNGSLDPLNGSFTVMNLVRTVYVQWQVPDGSGGLTWTPVDAITAWSTCAAHFTRYQILPTPTATTINWRTDRRAAPALLEVWIDGQLYKHLSTDDGDQISQSVQLPALCSSGSHIAEMIVINSRGAWASSERLASAKREVIAPGASDPAICIG